MAPTPQRRRPRRRQLNPAFASAHGLSQPCQQQQQKQRSSSSSAYAYEYASAAAASSQQPSKKVDASIRAARSSGRLNLSSCSLTALPPAIFDLRRHIEIDLSMDSSDNPGAWQSYGEEEVTTMDLSDNPLHVCSSSGNADADGNAKAVRLDDRLVKFVSLKSLRAKRCNLTELSWSSVLSRLDNLLILDVSGNQLTEARLEYLPMTVREVDLSCNKLTTLVESVSASMVQDNGSAATSRSSNEEPVIVLPNLIRLDVSNNQLTKLPHSMEVPSLQTLCFGHNRIDDLSVDVIVQCSKSLSTLEGPHNQLRSVPDLFGCSRLTMVDLSENLLTDTPAINPSVIRLNLNDNALSSIRGLFSGAQIQSDTFRSDLAELRLHGNKLISLDDDIMRCLTKMTLLDAGQNDLTDLPRVLGYLPQLRRVPLDGNALRVIRSPLATNTAALKEFLRKRGPPPPGPGYLAGPDPAAANGGGAAAPLPTSNEARGIVSSALVGTFTLDLVGKNIEGLPGDIRNEMLVKSTAGDGTVGGRIKKIVLSKNSLKNLDDWLEVMPNLSSVDAAQNQIESIASCIDEIPLAELRMPRNQLSAAALASSAVCSTIADKPSALAMNLTCIDLSGNRLEWFPSGLGKLPRLSTLILANNGIRTLAVGMEAGMESGWRHNGFEALETLNLSSNEICNLGEMPVCLIECSPLIRNLSLANNELPVIPPELGVLETLTSIDLRGNPQRRIRVGILDRSTTEILTYLRSRMEETELRNLQGKLASCSAAMGSSSGESGSASVGEDNKVEELKRNIQDITIQLNNVHLTEAKKYAMKKTLKMHKAALIKEERRIRMGAGK